MNSARPASPHEVLGDWPAWYRLRKEDEVAISSLLLHARAGPGVSTLILTGPPGTGKTALASAFAEAIGGHLLVFLGHHWVTQEDLFGRVDPARVAALAGGLLKASPGEAYHPGVLVQAALSSWVCPTVLLLDEWDKTREAADALLLLFLQDEVIVLPAEMEEIIRRLAGAAADRAVRIIGGQVVVRANRANLFVIITSNEVRPLSDPLLRRGIRHRMGFLPPEVEADLIRKDTGLPPRAAALIVRMMNVIRTHPEGSSPSLHEGLRLARTLAALRRGEIPGDPARTAEILIRLHLVKTEADWGILRRRIPDPGAVLWGELVRAPAAPDGRDGG